LTAAARHALAAGTIKAYFKGNGANVIKIAPETAMKLTFNDGLKHLICRDSEEITPGERMVCGGIAGAVAQVRSGP
jgi:solute carrier family 25 phosphate transporter 23/24/25/41